MPRLLAGGTGKLFFLNPVTRKTGTKSKQSLPSVEVLFGESAAGIAISGDSGSGKSNLMQLLMQALIRQGLGLTLIDPHGDLAADLERYCASLPERTRHRVILIRYCDTTRIAGIHDPPDLPGVLNRGRLGPQGIGLNLKRQHVFVREVVLHDAGQRRQPQFAGGRVPIEAVHDLVAAQPPNVAGICGRPKSEHFSREATLDQCRNCPVRQS